jgi:urea transport system permease protein
MHRPNIRTWLRVMLAALLLAAAPLWAATPLTQADLKPLAEDDYDAKTAALNKLTQAPAEQAGPILKALQDDALQYAPSVGMVRQDGDKTVDAVTGKPVTVRTSRIADAEQQPARHRR